MQSPHRALQLSGSYAVVADQQRSICAGSTRLIAKLIEIHADELYAIDHFAKHGGSALCKPTVIACNAAFVVAENKRTELII